MARLNKIWIEDCDGEKFIRIDWDNGRHQCIKIDGNQPEDVITALRDSMHLLIEDHSKGKI